MLPAGRASHARYSNTATDMLYLGAHFGKQSRLHHLGVVSVMPTSPVARGTRPFRSLSLGRSRRRRIKVNKGGTSKTESLGDGDNYCGAI